MRRGSASGRLMLLPTRSSSGRVVNSQVICTNWLAVSCTPAIASRVLPLASVTVSGVNCIVTRRGDWNGSLVASS